MDVGHLRKARSGSDFLDYGTGDVRIKTLGDQDEDVDIDDGDTDAAPHMDASVAGVCGGATGVGTGAKSMAGSTLAPRLGVANVVSSTSSHGRREQHTAGSQASIGRQTLPQLAVGEDGSSKYSDASVPKVSTEGTSKRMHASEFRKQMSAKTSGRRVRPLEIVQPLAKRKALETEPSTSAPAKRIKVNGNSSDSSDTARKNNIAEEVQPRDIALTTRKEDSPLKRKEIFKDGVGEVREKSLRESIREKRLRMLVIADDSDEDMLEQDEASAKPKSNEEGNELSGVKAAAEMSVKNDSHPVGSAKTGPAGENGLVPLRSAFPLHAKKKVHRSVSGDSKSQTGAGLATHIADENSSWKWITCTKCKKIRLVNADEDLKISSWCCEKNSRNPRYASCSAPQELNDHACKVEIDAWKEGQEISNHTSQLAKEKAQRKMVWVKLQVGGKHFWWPGLIVTVVPPAAQKKIDESADDPKAVRLFHPRKGLEEYQVVKKSSLRPFHLFLSYKESSSHPDFKVAVIEADQYFTQPDTQMEVFSQFATRSKNGAKLNAFDDYGRCHVEDVPHEHAESNELEFKNVEMLGDDPQRSQLQAEDEIEILEDGEVNQAPVDVSPEAGNGSGVSDRRDDLELSQPQASKEREKLEDEEVIQVPVEQGKAEDSLDAGHGDVSSFEDDDPQCSLSQGDQVKNGMPDARAIDCTATGASEQGNDQNSPEPTNGFDLIDKRDEVSRSTMIEVESSKEIHIDAKVFEDMEASERTKASEASGFEELYIPGENFVLNVEISPTRRLIAYDDATKELRFQDGAAVSIDAVNLGKEFNKCSTGPSLHQCIRELGKSSIRRRFPKCARSSYGLKFDGLDLNDNFAIRLRDTWLREYKSKPMPEYLMTRFVAGCILEERGESVNWASELTRLVRNELKQINIKKRESLSPDVLKLIVHLLEKKVDPAPIAAAPLPNFEAVKGEELVDFADYDRCCHQCNHGGELLCCDGRGCRRTYHLQCLNPPLEEVPVAAFLCPSCLAKAPAHPGVEVVTSSLVENDIKLHTDDVFRQEPQGVAESSTVVGEIDTLECPASVDSRPNLEVDTVTTEAVVELADTLACTSTIGEGINLLENYRTVDAAHQLPESNAHESEHTALVDLENNNGFGDRCVSPMDSGATLGELANEVIEVAHESQIRSSPSLVVDSLHAKNHVLLIVPEESELEEGEISPSEQVNAIDKTVEVDILASKLPCSSTPPLTQEVSARVELPYEEDEFPSSDDHNSICEGCDVGGELMLCDGKGCRVVYHKECLDPPLQTVPAGEWYCPECEKGRVEKIWSVRNVYETSKRRGRAATKGSDASSPESDSEDEALDDMPLDSRFKSTLQRPDGEVAAHELGKASGTRAGIVNTNVKDDGVEYLVQWKSHSHAHDKWVSEKELEKIAPKELSRFKKLLQQGQVKYDSEWAKPERVIQKRLTRVTRRQSDAAVEKGNTSNQQEAEIEWFVKWKGLGYEYCTWEPAGTGVLASPGGMELITAYERWADAARQRARPESREEAENRLQSRFKALDCQPEWMIRPEQEQLDALNNLLRLWHSRMNGILVYEASQEKIVMTIMFFLSLVEHYRVVHPILVVVPKSLIQNWEHELFQWAPKLYIVNYASKLEEARDIIRREEFRSFSEPFRPQIVLTSFDVINCDMEYLKKVEWEALIIDEGRTQRLQKSCQKFYRIFSQIRSIFRLLLLSEPLKSNVEELIQFVNFLEPRKSVFPHGDESTQVTELRRRLTGRVLEYIPKNRLTEYWVPVEMTPVHLDQYYNLLVRHYPTFSRNHRDHQIQEVVTKLRQSCNHPFLADPALEGTIGDGLTPKELLDHHIEISGKMRLLHMMMPLLKSAGWRVLIFSQETKQLNILERYMTQSHGSDSYERVDHDIAVNVKEAAIQRFNVEGSKRFVLLLKTGIHVSFKNVQFVLIYDSDWNPENDMRALHKIHNEGESGSKPLPVLRLYTHLTVEESTLALSRDEKLPPTRASFSAKICQKLLTWGASKIFDHFDNSTGSLYRPKGAKICPKAKLKQVVYNSEVVSNLLKALLCQEESSKLEGDELLEAILIPRDEPAPLFSENDHPITMIAGDSARAFWASALKWRHDDWQAKKVNTLGKRHRGTKRITYDEDAMASAVYDKAQLPEGIERKRPRRRKASSDEEQEVVTGPTDPVSFLSNSLPSEGTLPPTHREQMPGNTDTSQLQQTEVVVSTHGSVNHEHASNQNTGSEQIRSDASTMLPGEMFPVFLSKICSFMDLPRPVNERVNDLFKHLLQVQKNLRKPRAHHEIFAIQLCVVWLAAEQLNHVIDKPKSICMVEERLSVSYSKRDQFVGDLYKKVRDLCKNFKPRPAPPVVVSTTSQLVLVPEMIPPRSPLPNHPPTAESEPSPQNVHPQAIDAEEPARNLSVLQLEGSQGTCIKVDAEVPLPVPQSVLVTLPVGNGSRVEEGQVVVEPADADTEVVLVEADPRLVPEVPEHEPVQFPVPDGTITSGASSLEQGLGWVLVGTPPDVPVGDPAGVGPATLGACPVEVVPTESIQQARQTEQRPANTLASLTKRLFQDKRFVINIQCREMQLMKTETSRKLLVRKKQYDDCRLRPSPDPGMVDGIEAHYKQDKATIERQSLQDEKALEARQRADRDKLNDLYNKLISDAAGDSSDLDVRRIEAEIQRITEYYTKIYETSTSSPLQGSVDQRPSSRSMPSRFIPSSTLATEALPTSTVQADGSSHAAHSSANPAVNYQRRHSSRVSSPAIPAVSSQRGHAVQSVPGQVSPHSQRPAVISTASTHPISVQPVTGQALPHSQRPAMQPNSVQTRGQVQRSSAPVHLNPTLNVQRGSPAVSRSLQSTPPMVSAVPPSVGSMARPPAPASATPLAGSATGQVYPDVLLKEKEKLNKELEKAKIAYESESQRIKCEYDTQAEILHKKYESLLVDQHRAYTKRQQQVQQNIVKVEWNRQLAEALRLREELAARAAVFAGIAAHSTVHQQASQQISGRPQTSVVSAPASISRGTTNTVSAGSGVTMQPLGTSSTRVSTAPSHHSPRFGMPVNEQSRSSMSEAMAVLAASGNAVSPEMNVDVPQPRTSQSSPAVLAPMSPPFEDPILAIIRDSAPLVEESPLEASTSAGASLPNPEPTHPPTSGIDQRSQALPEAQTHPGADSVSVVEGSPVQLPSHIRSGTQEQAANVEALGRPHSLIYLSDSDDGD